LSTIRQLHGISGSKVDYQSRYTIGSELYFDRFGEGREFLETGWGNAKDWGTWSEGAQSTLSLALDRPTAGVLRLGILIRRRKGSALKLRVSLDNYPLGAWELKDDHYQWLNVTIPAAPQGRFALDLAFHLEAMEGRLGAETGFGIKQLHVEEIGWNHRLLKAGRRSCSLAAAGFLGFFGKNRITPGKEVGFHKEGRGIWLLGKGWGKPSSTGCKMVYDRADLKGRLAWAWPPVGRLVLKMWARVDQEILDQDGGRLALVVGEQRLFLQKVSTETSAWFEAVLPKSAFQDGVLHLKLWKQQGNLEIEKLVVEPRGKA
jgi:hypothetical protein